MLDGGRKFFVLDRDFETRRRLCYALSMLGEPVPIAMTGDLLPFAANGDWVFKRGEPVAILRLATTLREAKQALPIIAFGPNPAGDGLASMIEAGAAGYLRFPATPDEVSATIGLIEPAAKQAASRLEAAIHTDTALSRLSPREVEVMTSACLGLSNKQIARALGISPRTVEIHRSSALRKLKLDNCYQALCLFLDAQRGRPPGLSTLPSAELIKAYRDKMAAVRDV